MKRFIILFLLFFQGYFAVGLKAQELYSLADKAEEAFQHLDYAVASGYYEKLLTEGEKPLYIDRLAICYFKMKEYDESIKWLKKSLSLDPENVTLRFYYAECITHLGNYSFALTQYRYVKTSDKILTSLVALRIKSCEMALELVGKTSSYKIIRDSVLNTLYSEFSVSPAPDGILFASDRPVEGHEIPRKSIYGWTNTPYLNLFHSRKNSKGKLENPKIFSEDLISNYHTATAVFSPDFKTIFFTRTEYVPNSTALFGLSDKNEKLIHRLQIFYSNWIKGAWSPAKSFPYNQVNRYSVGHPAITRDGKTLFFASDMPGGKGGIDLYSSEIKPGGVFGIPVNLGDSINTAGNEEFPVIGADNKLYFSSDGLPGLGGLDNFKADGDEFHWSKPQNLGVPINSPMDDFGFFPTDSLGLVGYFSSNRIPGMGRDDIYTFTYSEPLKNLDTNRFIRGRIVNSETAKGIGDVKLDILEGGDSISNQIITDSLGYYTFAKKQSKQFILRIKKVNYFTLFDTLNFNEKGLLTSRLKPEHLIPMVINRAIRLENIHYSFNSWAILPQAAQILDGLVKVLKDNPEISINLDSHTDTRGDSYINKYISVHRAGSAVAYLISQGINPSRLKARGFGKDLPLISCDKDYKCTDEDHQLNRRTEFRITRIIPEKT